MRCALCDIIWTGFDPETRIIWRAFIGLLAFFSFLAAIEQPVFCVLGIFILLIVLTPTILNAIDKILEYCKKSRACDEETHPTNVRAEDEDTHPTNDSLDPTVVQGSKKEDEEPPKYEDIERRDALELPNYNECCQKDTIMYESETPV